MMRNERGSIFFYILLGVVLFATLSLAVTQAIRVSGGGSNGGTNSGQVEKSALNISEVQQYLESVRIRVNTLMISNGVSETALDFQNDVYKLGNNTDNCWNNNPNCTNSACKVFAPYSPDGLTPMVISSVADTPEQTDVGREKNGHGAIKQLIIDGVGSAAPDLVFELKGVSPTFCNYYNEKQGITTAYTSATTYAAIGEDFNDSGPENFGGCGTPASFNGTHVFGDDATEFSGKKTFCAPADNDPYDHRLSIFYVLKAR